MRRSASYAATLIVLLAVTALAGAALRRNTDSYPPSDNPASAAAPAGAKAGGPETLFIQSGIDPNSNKARIILAWMERVRHDPVIAAGIPGGARRVGQIFVDPAAREEFMAQGIARLSPADRLKYVQLLTKFLDELVPVNCFGLSDMRAVMNRVSLNEMQDADVDQYFDLLFKVLVSDASNAPISTPTPQQFADAERKLTHALVAQLHGNEADIERLAFYASNPSMATPSDACWTTRVTLHAIIAMPDPERDLILLHTMMPRGRQDASTMKPWSAPGSHAPLPASSQPGGAGAP
ncbi:hypothetical protein J8I87_17565 [Paraburkholderia sp. LEh10]|uniref:hypothetical protein n=1 Tax=Paraburkholderia sp. LEh10 TaxID=2821353 RepID=UPI001AE1CD70|nr:hypothetical protein [Paraburkholderia sp. LEh10]MBP0591499.1 hypothetical protein [Paraburkholderia sp. LEh10]